MFLTQLTDQSVSVWPDRWKSVSANNQDPRAVMQDGAKNPDIDFTGQIMS